MVKEPKSFREIFYTLNQTRPLSSQREREKERALPPPGSCSSKGFGLRNWSSTGSSWTYLICEPDHVFKIKTHLERKSIQLMSSCITRALIIFPIPLPYLVNLVSLHTCKYPVPPVHLHLAIEKKYQNEVLWWIDLIMDRLTRPAQIKSDPTRLIHRPGTLKFTIRHKN